MGASRLWAVTEVAPYRDGPAGVHGVLTQAGTALAELGAMRGLEPEVIADVSAIDADDLRSGGVLALFTIGETPWNAEQRTAIVSSVRDGALGILGVHAATDACAAWDDYGALLGARFDGHPWTCDFSVVVSDPDHPATRDLPARWPWHDEVYLFRALRPDARILLRVAAEDLDMTVAGARTPTFGFPLCWCHTEGAGRCFYSALGHFPGAWENPTYLAHLAGGLDWVLERGE